jgi:hypothetical protein
MSTIVINHDLSQIEDDDFIYVLKHGRVVKQGFCHDLEADPFSTFRNMTDALGGFPVRNLDSPGAPTDAAIEAILDKAADAHRNASRLSIYPVAANNCLTLSNWMFDAVHDLSPRPTQSRFVPMDGFAREEETMTSTRRRGSIDVRPRPRGSPAAASASSSRRPRPTSTSRAPRPHPPDLEGIAKQAAASKESHRRFDAPKIVAEEPVAPTPAAVASAVHHRLRPFFRSRHRTGSASSRSVTELGGDIAPQVSRERDAPEVGEDPEGRGEQGSQKLLGQ